jgi:DNA-binding protein YbaB
MEQSSDGLVNITVTADRQIKTIDIADELLERQKTRKIT